MSLSYGIHWSQLRLGVAVILVITVSAITVFFIDDVGDALEGRYTLYFHTFTRQNLAPRAPVWLAGQPVGLVRSIEFITPDTSDGGSERLRIELSVREAVREFILEGSAAQVITAGLVGQVVVNILPSIDGGDPLPSGGLLVTATEVDPIQLGRQLRTIGDSLQPVVARWSDVSDAAFNGDGTLARIWRQPEDLQQLRDRLSLLSARLDTVGVATRHLSRLLLDEDVRSSLRRIGPRISTLSTRLNESPLQRALAEGKLSARLESIAGRITRIRARIDSGQGSLGRALNDRSLQVEMERTRQMVRELRADLAALLMGGSDRDR